MGQWVLGEDVGVIVYRDGKQVACVRNIKSFKVSINVEAVLRNYLGRDAPDVDQTFNGGEFDLELDHDDPSYLTLVDSVVAVGQHRTPGITFSVGFKVSYPGGARVRALMREVAFDPMDLSFGGRTEPLTSRLSGKFRKLSNISGATPV